MITLNETKIARRGRGAVGYAQVAVIGIPKVSEDGVCKDIDYSEVKYSASELMEYIQKHGMSLTLLLSQAIDSYAKKVALTIGSASTMLRMRIISLGLAKDEEGAKKIAQSVTSSAPIVECSTEDILESMCGLKGIKYIPREIEVAETDDETTDEAE